MRTGVDWTFTPQATTHPNRARHGVCRVVEIVDHQPGCTDPDVMRYGVRFDGGTWVPNSDGGTWASMRELGRA